MMTIQDKDIDTHKQNLLSHTKTNHKISFLNNFCLSSPIIANEVPLESQGHLKVKICDQFICFSMYYLYTKLAIPRFVVNSSKFW